MSQVFASGVLLSSNQLALWVAHTQIDTAPSNDGREGGVKIVDAEGREWVLDLLWLHDYQQARDGLKLSPRGQ